MAADVADAFCDGEIRLTVDQKLLFPNVNTAKVSEMTKMPFFEKFPVVSAEFVTSPFYWFAACCPLLFLRGPAFWLRSATMREEEREEGGGGGGVNLWNIC